MKKGEPDSNLNLNLKYEPNKIPLKRDASGPEGYSDTVPVGWTENCALGSFKLQFSFGFVTSCYVIMNISIA